MVFLWLSSVAKGDSRWAYSPAAPASFGRPVGSCNEETGGGEEGGSHLRDFGGRILGLGSSLSSHQPSKQDRISDLLGAQPCICYLPSPSSGTNVERRSRREKTRTNPRFKGVVQKGAAVREASCLSAKIKGGRRRGREKEEEREGRRAAERESSRTP